MFANNNESDSKTESKTEISTAGAIAILGVLVAIVFQMKIGNHPEKLERLQFQYFEYAYYAGYALIAGLMGYILWMVIKKTKGLVERFTLLKPMMSCKEDSISVGKTKDDIDLYLTDQDRTTHVQIIGSTGRGKTESVIIPWASRDAKRGKSFVIIDGKGSPDLKERVLDNARLSGQNPRILHFDLNDQNYSGHINPLSHGSPQQITDRLFTSLTFEEPFYKSLQSDICGTLIKLIHSNGEEVSFKKLFGLLTDDDVLAGSIGKCSDEAIKKRATAFLKQSKKDRDKNVYGLVSQIAPFAEGELAQIVNGDPLRWRQDSIHLAEIIINGGYSMDGEYEKEKRPFALVISIPTLKYQESGHILGKLILQDIAYAIGERESKQDNEFLSIFLDEFSEFVFPKFISTLNKARSANVAFHLSHQSMGDLAEVSDSFAKSVVTNTNVKCILGLNDPDTADYFSRHFGTFTEEKMTEQVDGIIWGEFQKTGMMSVREVESFRIGPNVLKSLNRGEGVLHLPSPRGNISEVLKFQSFSQDKELGFESASQLVNLESHNAANEMSDHLKQFEA